MKLRKLHIEDYKMFKDFDISFVDENDEALPIVVLAGVNGSGKTTILETLSFQENIVGKMKVIENNNYLKITLSKSDKVMKFSKDKIKVYKKKYTNSIVFFPLINGREYRQIEKEFVKSFYFFLKEKDYRPSEVKEHFHNYMKDIFDGLDLTFKYSHLDRNDNVWFSNDNGEEFKINELSTGEQTLLSKILYLYFLGYKNKVILIDEPELSLHPSWQNKVLKIYENFAKNNNCQIIIATHSPHIIGSAKAEYVRVLKKVEDKIEVREYTKSYGLEFDKILTDIMGVENLRTPDVAKDINRLWDLLEDEDYESEEYRELYQKLEDILGSLDKDMVLARLEVAKIKSQNAKFK